MPVTLAGLRPARAMLLEGAEPVERAADEPLVLSPFAVAFVEG
jgi:hypothetical protein